MHHAATTDGGASRVPAARTGADLDLVRRRRTHRPTIRRFFGPSPWTGARLWLQL